MLKTIIVALIFCNIVMADYCLRTGKVNSFIGYITIFGFCLGAVKQNPDWLSHSEVDLKIHFINLQERHRFVVTRRNMRVIPTLVS